MASSTSYSDVEAGPSRPRASKMRTRKAWHEWEKNLLKREFNTQVNLTGREDAVDWNAIYENMQQFEYFKRSR
jgi:hypothetical protein